MSSRPVVEEPNMNTDREDGWAIEEGVTCEATVTQNWSSYQCRKPGTALRCRRMLCTTHARQFDKWVDDPNRDAPGMAEFWWGWK